MKVIFYQGFGLKTIIAIHSTALGPALGGTRFYPYASTDDAIADVLNLSRGMAYKNALAGLDLGGREDLVRRLGQIAQMPLSPVFALPREIEDAIATIAGSIRGGVRCGAIRQITLTKILRKTYARRNAFNEFRFKK